jgi:hypothetical protein
MIMKKKKLRKKLSKTEKKLSKARAEIKELRTESRTTTENDLPAIKVMTAQ